MILLFGSDVPVNDPAPAGGEIDPAINARVADNHRHVRRAELVLVVVYAHPRPARVVGAVTGVKAADVAQQENRGISFSRRGHSKTNRVRAFNRVELGERDAAIGRMEQAAIARAGPQVAFDSESDLWAGSRN